MNIEVRKGLIIKNSIPEGFVITDKNISDRYNSLISNKNFIISPGEKSKSLENYKEIMGLLGNTNTIVALGGGVVGDLSGFIASTYKRGINLIQIPTTLLAMVDSSIGGKNGLNLGSRKNYIGTIYQPKQILIDPLFLDTLPEEEFQNGIAEIVKYAYLFGKPSLERLKSGLTAKDVDIEEIISLCCENKLEVVKKDEFDSGFRHILNFGHTIGHAIELLCNLSHGKAVSIGMVIELEIGERIGITSSRDIEDVKQTLKMNNLPTELPKDANAEKIIELMRYDKKGEFIFAFNRENYCIKVEENIIREILSSASQKT